jgi:DNA-binding NtrC family response regulator
VLVLEPDRDLRNAIAAILGEANHTSIEVVDVATARPWAIRADVLLIDSDLLMAGDSDVQGDDVCELLCELARRDDAPAAIVLASYRLGRTRELAERFSLSVLMKPFDLDDLLEVIERAHVRRERPRLRSVATFTALTR